MKLERPGDRFWPRALNLVNVFLSILLLLICRQINRELMWIGNIIVCSLISISLTAIVISYRDDTLFGAVDQKRRDAEYDFLTLKSKNERLDQEMKAKDDKL